jgi:hypothetical protein
MTLNPSGELSTIRQGSLLGIRSRLTTRLALFFWRVRFDRRFSRDGNPDTDLSPMLIPLFATLVYASDRPGITSNLCNFRSIRE